MAGIVTVLFAYKISMTVLFMGTAPLATIVIGGDAATCVIVVVDEEADLPEVVMWPIKNPTTSTISNPTINRTFLLLFLGVAIESTLADRSERLKT